MPSLKKKSLSLYLRTGCQRQLALNVFGGKEGKALQMPPPQKARAGLGLVGKAGYEWQDEKISELASVFGAARLHVNPQTEAGRPSPLDLAAVLPRVLPYEFVVEGRYDAETDAFRRGVGISDIHDRRGERLKIGEAFPDIIQVFPPICARSAWERGVEDGGLHDGGPDALALEVLHSGDVRPLDSIDGRLRLRVIDIKQSSEPGAHYFAEVVYYSITLAAWLLQNGWSNRFVVVAAPAVWPGSYEASAIAAAKEVARKEAREPTPEELALALEDDIEVAPFDVFAPRLRRFFREELPLVLETPWAELPWHLSFVCNGCEFLGYPWLDKDGGLSNHKLHCWPTAEREDHISRIAGLSKGGAKLIADIAPDVRTLANVNVDHPAFDRSPSLRAKRTLYPYRALALRDRQAGVIPASGGDALMPRWPDLHIYTFLDYDLASAVTAAFSLRAYWKEPLPFHSEEKPKVERWAAHGGTQAKFQEVFLVDDRRDLTREQQELVKFLRALRTVIDSVRSFDDADVAAGRRGNPNVPEKAKRSTYQIYLWDVAQQKHLVRIVGRHLGAILADPHIRDLAWLFPPPELLAHPEEASFNSPFTVVASVVQNTVTIPAPHHYTLLETVQLYRPAGVAAPSVHPLYREPLSDLIPGERIHEMWTHRGNWLETMNTIQETTQKKLSALAYVVGQLERDLKDVLNRSAAPPVVRTPKRVTGITPHSQLLHEFTRLNAALDELESHAIRAMPPHEREARFKSAHLLRRLEGDSKAAAFQLLQAGTQSSLPSADELAIYSVAPGSRDVNIRPPAIGYALAPRADPGFLNRSAFPLIKDIPQNLFRMGRTPHAKGSVADAGLTQVSVLALDRIQGLIALKPWKDYQVGALEQSGVVDLSVDVMLDPVSTDFLTKKVRLTLQAIGIPLSAAEDQVVLRALGASPSRATPTPEGPASEFLWQATALANTPVARSTSRTRQVLEATGVSLNPSQWIAWEAALTRRLALVWGPPGTGKTQTLRAVIAGAVWAAHSSRRPLRAVISANTYAASDNVLIGANTLLTQLLPSKSFRLIRLQSSGNAPPADLGKPEHVNVEKIIVSATWASKEVIALQKLLQSSASGIVIVTGTPQQLHNLAMATSTKSSSENPARTKRPWFDLVIVDEASQLDVAASTLILTKAAGGAAFVLAGDDKQLAPIHQATPPKDLGDVVGSVYAYVRHHHNVRPEPLQVNYRSNETLVEFTKRAGYDPGLHARNPDLRLSLIGGGFPDECPTNWPNELVWTSAFARILDPSKPATCFIYEDEVASQANDFEADIVASLVWLLFNRVDRQLAGEISVDGSLRNLTGEAHDERGFWERGVGIVTPHRAQMAKIVGRLQRIFPGHAPGLVWSAVDTVERFQGQQRDVIIASFGLGDPDLIRAEDEFLYQLNRFNVMASRARAKLIVLTTRTLVEHLSNDAEVLEQSRLLKYFAETFCVNPEPLTLSFKSAGTLVERKGYLSAR